MNYRIKNVIYTDRIRRKNVIHIDKMTGKSVDITEKTAYNKAMEEEECSDI